MKVDSLTLLRPFCSLGLGGARLSELSDLDNISKLKIINCYD